MTRQSLTVPVPKPGDGTKILLHPNGTMTCSWDPPDGRMALDARPGWAMPRGRDDRLGLGDNRTNNVRGRDAEEDGERRDDLRDGWEDEFKELCALLREHLPEDVYSEVEGTLHRLMSDNPEEAAAMGGEVMPVGRPSGRDADYRPTTSNSPGTDRRQAADAALQRAKQRKAESDAAAYYRRFPEARRARVV